MTSVYYLYFSTTLEWFIFTRFAFHRSPGQKTQPVWHMFINLFVYPHMKKVSNGFQNRTKSFTKCLWCSGVAYNFLCMHKTKKFHRNRCSRLSREKRAKTLPRSLPTDGQTEFEIRLVSASRTYETWRYANVTLWKQYTVPILILTIIKMSWRLFDCNLSRKNYWTEFNEIKKWPIYLEVK